VWQSGTAAEWLAQRKAVCREEVGTAARFSSVRPWKLRALASKRKRIVPFLGSFELFKLVYWGRSLFLKKPLLSVDVHGMEVPVEWHAALGLSALFARSAYLAFSNPSPACAEADASLFCLGGCIQREGRRLARHGGKRRSWEVPGWETLGVGSVQISVPGSPGATTGPVPPSPAGRGAAASPAALLGAGNPG